ncbi:MAG: FliA/WhiG family RNA polymerase sigma factor [Defluviitaleaceae bacterium]|nr:FliA/WhiG family RNA polymerase sigma factor [Defluviitaleaceae bacterium]MCL2275845.1 FliA/WhiG family RNA polymerase sigma factor [Defluviitaleaceae bacterium]
MENHIELWQAYAKNKTPALKEKLIILNAPLVKFVAGRMHMHIGQHVEYDDLIGYGVFGLIDAIEKFDYGKDVKFETYASFRIRGAIIDHIRRLDWVPRTLRQKNKQMETVYAQLEEENGREPTDEELAERLGIDVAATRDLMKKSSVLSLVSLDDFLDQNYETTFNGLASNKQDSPEEMAEKQERQQMLAAAIEKLNEKEKQVITLYYYEDLTLKEISSIMGVSESRISQIHTKAIGKLQGKLGKFKSLLFN